MKKVADDAIKAGIIELLQGDLPLEPRPYRNLAKKFNISEGEIFLHIEEMKNSGLIRRLGAVLGHQKAGYKVNSLVAWKIADEQADEIGKKMAAYNEISHCYLREVPEDFGYNLFSMIHSQSAEENQASIRKIALETGIKDFIILKSLKELKKTSMKYIDK
ncbi:MAG TPA: hypothetical protein VFC96_02645 [Anaerovoracaceae bacterium]|nr:hypothetical protein [Anaerovoracaceae bacterium]